jgi:hypothetical protein
LKLLLKYIAVWILAGSVFASAEVLTGNLKNGTTNQPASGDEVVLLSLGQGMEESGRTKTDAKGNFSFKYDDSSTPHLVRAIHQGVTYHRMAPPGTTSVELEVFDVSKKLATINVTADVIRLWAQDNELHGVRIFAVSNSSSPPRTQMNEQNFEFYLPDGAQIDTAMAKTAGGQPINSSPAPQKEKNRYAFVFPLRPGETQFQVAFHLPYRGQASIDPHPLYGAQHFVVMLPKTMQFSASAGSAFQSMQDLNRSDAGIQIVSDTKAGQPLTFKISGTGALKESGDEGQAGGEPAAGSAMTEGRDSRPGGGLGPPIDAPDPLEKNRWYILAGIAIVMVGGAIYITSRSNAAAKGDSIPPDVKVPPATLASAKPATPGKNGLLLEALKEEIFQLEVEHKQGTISQQDYEKAKAALDHTLERVVKRGV